LHIAGAPDPGVLKGQVATLSLKEQLAVGDCADEHAFAPLFEALALMNARGELAVAAFAASK